jgi:hypothetical protein
MDEKRLYTLLALVEDQAKALTDAADAMAAERKALVQAVAAAGQAADQARQATAAVQQAAAGAGQAVQKAAGAAIGAAVRDSLAGAAAEASRAAQQAARPVIEQLASAAKAAAGAGERLRGAGVSVGLIGLASALAIAAAGWGMTWWMRSDVEQLREQRALLAGEISRQQAQLAELERRGARVRWRDCGGRLCFEAAPGGAWQDKTTGVELVIPRGY